MKRCIYTFTRGIHAGQRCERTTDDLLCVQCNLKRAAQLQAQNWDGREETPYVPIMKPKSSPVPISEPMTEIVGTLRELCVRIPAKDIVREAQIICNRTKMTGEKDISLDVACAAKFLVEWERDPLVDGGDGIYIPFPGGMGWCENGSHVIMNSKAAENKFAVLDFKVDRGIDMSDAEVLTTIIWLMTMNGWPEGLGEWIGCGEGKLTEEEYKNLMKQKLGLN